MVDQKPKVRRDLSFQNLRQETQNLLLVEDPIGVIPEPLVLTEIAGLLLSLMDGRRTVEEIQSVFEEAVVGEVPAHFVADRVAELEELAVLETPEILAREREIIQTYTAASMRPASHAGQGYDASTEDLKTWLDQVLSQAPPSPCDREAPRFVVAPHIDFRVNTQVYAHAYSRLRGQRYDRVVLMGTGHAILEGFYCPTLKDFETPLGKTRNDREATLRLLAAGNGVLAPHDFPHRAEHALEFQMVFLQHLLGPDSFQVVPILCGSFHSLLSHLNRLGDEPHVRPFLEALRSIISEEGVRTLVVAGVDFSHVGLRFSHPVKADVMLEETRRHDRDLLEAFGQGDPDAFWRREAATGGKFNVCGFSTLSTLLEVMDTRGAETLGYDVWDDSPTGSAVTFAAIAG